MKIDYCIPRRNSDALVVCVVVFHINFLIEVGSLYCALSDNRRDTGALQRPPETKQVIRCLIHVKFCYLVTSLGRSNQSVIEKQGCLPGAVDGCETSWCGCGTSWCTASQVMATSPDWTTNTFFCCCHTDVCNMNITHRPTTDNSTDSQFNLNFLINKDEISSTRGMSTGLLVIILFLCIAIAVMVFVVCFAVRLSQTLCYSSPSSTDLLITSSSHKSNTDKLIRNIICDIETEIHQEPASYGECEIQPVSLYSNWTENDNQEIPYIDTSPGDTNSETHDQHGYRSSDNSDFRQTSPSSSPIPNDSHERSDSSSDDVFTPSPTNNLLQTFRKDDLTIPKRLHPQSASDELYIIDNYNYTTLPSPSQMNSEQAVSFDNTPELSDITGSSSITRKYRVSEGGPFGSRSGPRHMTNSLYIAQVGVARLVTSTVTCGKPAIIRTKKFSK